MAEQMSPEAQAAVTQLNELAYQLAEREKPVRRYLDYYRGAHKLCYASPEFEEYFAGRFEGFSDNWCAPVVNSPAERMNVLGVRLDDKAREVDAELARVWRANDGDAKSSEAFVVALTAGWAYGLVWGNPDDESTPRITFQRPDQAIVSFDGETGRRRAGLLLWRDDRTEFATLYQPNQVWKFSRSVVADGRTRSSLILPSTAIGGWEPRQSASDDTWPLPNPMGEVPLVELRGQTLLDDAPLSTIDGVIAIQDAINLVWAYLLNALDYASLPQRIVMGTDIPKVPVLNENGEVVGHRPIELDRLIRERILWVPGEHASTAEWTAANLDAYSHVVERAVEHIAAQTRTPPHYLIGKVANLSAEALTAAETGLVSKTGEQITYMTPGVREIKRMVALAVGDEAKARAVRSGTVMWADSQFRALGQKVDALLKMHTMGFPFEFIAEQYGLPPLEVQRVLAMRELEAQQKVDAALTAALLLDKQSDTAPQPDGAADMPVG